MFICITNSPSVWHINNLKFQLVSVYVPHTVVGNDVVSYKPSPTPDKHILWWILTSLSLATFLVAIS